MLKKAIKRVFGDTYIMYLRSFFVNQKERDLINKRKIFYSQFLCKGDLIFDVGANYGNRIKPFIELGLRIVAVEPQRECLKFLELKFRNKITIVPKGLGAEEGEKTMYISDSSPLSSFSQDWINANKESGRFGNYNWNKERKIEMTTLDNLIGQFGLPRFIKIDVEGFELEVLKGFSMPVEMISFEYTVPEQSDRAVLCMKRITEVYNNQVLFNYSVGESMEWGMNQWVTAEEMYSVLKSDYFVRTGFGDIYIRLNSKVTE